MSHIPGEAVQALFNITECKATDDAIICIAFDDNSQTAVSVKDEDGNPVTLGQLRELAAAFGAWL